MNTTRLSKLVIAVALVLAGLFAYQIFQNTAGAAANSSVHRRLAIIELVSPGRTRRGISPCRTES